MAAIGRDKVLALLLVSVVFLPLAGCGGLARLMDDDDGNGPPPGTLTLTADETNLAEGQSTILRWSSTNASAVVFSNFGATDVNGTAVVSPTTTTTYEMTVRCNGGTITARVCVMVTGGGGGGEPGEYLFDDLWGSQGSEPGQGESWRPSDVALDADANVYVVDTEGPCIQKFTSEGEFLTKWGSQGDGPGQFQFRPTGSIPAYRGVAVDAAGNVYVADPGNQRIQKFASDGQFLGQAGPDAGDPGQEPWDPADVAVDADGNVYVLDASNERIEKFSSEGQLLTDWGSPGGEGTPWWPEAVEVDAAGNVYVVSGMANGQGPCVLKFTGEGQLLSQWGVEAHLPDVALDGAGNVYVSDQDGHCIHKLSSEGELVTRLTFAGTGDPGAPGQISFPTGVAVDADGNLYVANTGFGGNWIIKFAPVTP